MPIYDYVCGNCGQTTEVIHGISAPGPRFCPACGAEGTLRKAFVAPTVHFKGAGWAKKDRSTASRARSRSTADTSSGEGGEAAAKKTDGAAATKDSVAGDPKGGSNGAETGASSPSKGTDSSKSAGKSSPSNDD